MELNKERIIVVILLSASPSMIVLVKLFGNNQQTIKQIHKQK
jgi:hypothetical protein